MTFVSLQLMTWFVSATWSVVADFQLAEMEEWRADRVMICLLSSSTSSLCSAVRVCSFLPDSPMLLHGMLYIPRLFYWSFCVCLSGGQVSYGWCSAASWRLQFCSVSWRALYFCPMSLSHMERLSCLSALVFLLAFGLSLRCVFLGAHLVFHFIKRPLRVAT